jgi:hypothetical protein
VRIAIIGRGTSGIVSALVCLIRGHNVEIYYDSEQPHINVGESTTPIIGGLINKALKISISELRQNGIASFKNGVKFIDWGYGESDYFLHHFYSDNYAFHFETSTFNPFLNKKLEENGVIYHSERVDSYEINSFTDKIMLNGRHYDFLINCSGWFEDEEYYNDPIFETVNSGILYKEDYIDDPTYTIHRATEDGWQFGLPFPDRNLTKCGYFFNNKFEDPKEVQKKLGKENSRIVTWKQKYAKRMMVNKFIANNGNKLMFTDPLHALALHYYSEFAEIMCDYLEDRTLDHFEYANQKYYDEIFKSQMSVAFHYSYGSKHHSTFWKDAQERSIRLLNTHPKYQRESFQYAYKHAKKYNDNKFIEFGLFGYRDYIELHSGMTGISKDEICNSIKIPGFE